MLSAVFFVRTRERLTNYFFQRKSTHYVLEASVLPGAVRLNYGDFSLAQLFLFRSCFSL